MDARSRPNSDNLSSLSNLDNQRPTYKVVILGDTDVGKSCFIKRYIDGKFSDNLHSSVGEVFFTKKLRAEFDQSKAN